MKNISILFCFSFIVISASSQTNLGHTWSKSLHNTAEFLGAYYSDMGNKITTDAAGNIYVLGAFMDTVDFDPGPGEGRCIAANWFDTLDIFFAKYDANGNFIYAKSLYGLGDDYARGIAVDAAGNVYITGTYRNNIDVDPDAAGVYFNSEGLEDIFIAKYDAAGNYVFAKTIGSTGADKVSELLVDASGNIYITGNFAGFVDFDPGAGTAMLSSAGLTDIFIAKYDANGNYVYAKKISGNSTETVGDMAMDATGNLYITGQFIGTVDFDPSAPTVALTSINGINIFIAKYTSTGDYGYAKRIVANTSGMGLALTADANSNILVTGSFRGTVDFDPGASSANLTSAGNDDAFIAKYDASGNYVYAKRLGTTTSEFGTAITTDASGNVYVAGEFENTVDFDAGAGTFNLTSAGSQDIFVTKYDASGNFILAKAMGGNGSDLATDILQIGNEVYLTGGFSAIADLDPNATSVLHTAPNSMDIFFARYAECSAPGISATTTTAATTTVSGPVSLTDGGCSLLAVITPGGANPISGAVNASMWIEPSVPSFAGQPYVARHYEITPVANASTATGSVTLYFTQQDFDDFNADPGSILNLPATESDSAGKSHLRISKYPGTSSNGSGLPGSYAASSTGIDPDDNAIVWNSALSRWEITFDVTGFSGFFVQTNMTTLPLTLLDFKARLVDDKAMLQWKTENEINASNFIIERSDNGRIYSAVGSVAALNNAEVHYYQFTDHLNNLPATDIIYYRLKQTDIDGRSHYSRIVALPLGNSNTKILFYPNPVISETSLTMTTHSAGKIHASIVDNTGRVVRQQQWILAAGTNSVSLYVNGLTKGIYYVVVQGENISYRKKFLKQ